MARSRSGRDGRNQSRERHGGSREDREEARAFHINPKEHGLASDDRSALRGGDAKENAAILTAVLAGNGTKAQNAAVILNAAAGLTVYGKVTDFGGGVALASDILASGKGYENTGSNQGKPEHITHSVERVEPENSSVIRYKLYAIHFMNVLTNIIANKKKEIARAKRRLSLAEIARFAETYKREERSFKSAPAQTHWPYRGNQIKVAFTRKLTGGGFEELARLYAKSGTSAISVLTDKKYFNGSIDYIARVRYRSPADSAERLHH